MEIRVPEQTINLSKEDLITMIMTTGVSFDAGNSSRMHNFPDGIIYEPSYMCFGWNPYFKWGKWSELFLLKFYIKISKDGLDSIKDFYNDINQVRINPEDLYLLRVKTQCQIDLSKQ